MDETLHAYAAGFVDGEGCITINRGQPNKYHMSLDHNARVFVTNTNLQVLNLLQENYGGTIYRLRSKSERGKGWKSCYVWNLGVKNLVGFLKAILPYLVVKQQQALLALEFMAARKVMPHVLGVHLPDEEITKREDYYQKMQKLNHSDQKIK